MELDRTFRSNPFTINNKHKALFRLQVVHLVLLLALIKLMHLLYLTKFKAVII